jgi:hypothetical protein
MGNWLTAHRWRPLGTAYLPLRPAPLLTPEPRSSFGSKVESRPRFTVTGTGVQASRAWYGALPSSLSLALLLVFGLTAQVCQAGDSRLVVVPTQNSGAAPLGAQVIGRLGLPLRRSTTLVPLSLYKKSAKKAGISLSKLSAPQSVVAAAHGTAATHVLLLRTTADRDLRSKRGRTFKVHALRAILVDAHSGETLFNRRYGLPTGRVPSDVTSTVAADIGAILSAYHASRRSHSAPPPIEPLPPVATAALPAQNPADMPAYVPGGAPAEAAQGQPPEAPGAPAQAARDIPFGSSGTPDQAVPQTTNPDLQAPAVRLNTEGARPGLRLNLGPNFFNRSASITALPGQTPPRYHQPKGVRPPIFARVLLQGEINPLSFGGSGAWYEGLGVHFDANLGAARTGIAGGTPTTSLLGGGSLGLHYRWVLFTSKLAPDLMPRVGITTFAFPLKGAQFPGIGYKSPYLGLGANFPITENFALRASGHYLPRVVAFGGSSALGVQVAAGWGYHVEGGLRVTVLEHLEFSALATIDQYNAPFVGPTALPNSNVQYGDVKLRDTLVGAMLGIGCAL